VNSSEDCLAHISTRQAEGIRPDKASHEPSATPEQPTTAGRIRALTANPPQIYGVNAPFPAFTRIDCDGNPGDFGGALRQRAAAAHQR
jgi:hypothetical protein